ncbi:zinc finger family protein [Musa troglodytarum]|uniref:Zinc finger family protein n=1 Tax=Musa troglodytarum TaxID=320322 RepID=A0A9E7JK88_9LILI|nr:zinc finger family protein [Musa troglodytarum]
MEKLRIMKHATWLVVSSLDSGDRLSIVAFSIVIVSRTKF